MAYETLSTIELQKELLRRTVDMENWTNDINLAKARDDVKELEIDFSYVEEKLKVAEERVR